LINEGRHLDFSLLMDEEWRLLARLLALCVLGSDWNACEIGGVDGVLVDVKVSEITNYDVVDS
jgi:hypothetical protein